MVYWVSFLTRSLYVKSMLPRDDNDNDMKRNEAACKIQKVWIKKAYSPPNGCMYKCAKRHFEMNGCKLNVVKQ